MQIPSIEDKIISYRRLFERSTEGFSGRAWLDNLVDRFLKEEGAPQHLLILGEPGCGKTTYMAHLAQTRRYVCHFIGRGTLLDLPQSPAWRDPIRMAMSIGYQLTHEYGDWIMDWRDWGITVNQKIQELGGVGIGVEVDQYEVDGRPAIDVDQEVERLLPAAELIGVYIKEVKMDPEPVIQQLVTKPLVALSKVDSERQIVVLLDGLDEAEDHSNPQHSILKQLPLDQLPDNIRFVFASRPGSHLPVDFQNLCRIVWLSGDPQGVLRSDILEDARQYAINLSTEKRVAGLLEERGHTVGAFANAVALASQGNFLYLYHYAQSLHDDDVDDDFLDLKTLPQGLNEIYDEILRCIRNKVDNIVFWTTLVKPVLGILAVAREPLTNTQIRNFSKVSIDEVTAVLTLLRRFVDQIGAGGGLRYTVYHPSFANYLVSALNDDRIDEVNQQCKIAQYYTVLARKWGPDNWGGLDAYGRRYLPFHATEAGILDELVARPAFWLYCEPTAVRDSLEAASGLSFDVQATAAIFALAFPDLLHEEPLARAAVLHLGALMQGATVVAAFFEPVIVNSPWRALWSHTDRGIIPFRQRKTEGQIKAQTAAIVNDRLYVVTVEQTDDRFADQLSIWAPVEDTVRTTVIRGHMFPRLRVLEVGNEVYIELIGREMGTESIALFTFEGLNEVHSGWNFAVAMWVFDDELHAVEADFGGGVFLRPLGSPPMYVWEGELGPGVTLERSPETLHEMPVFELNTSVRMLQPLVTERDEPILAVVDKLGRLSFLFLQEVDPVLVDTKLKIEGGSLVLKYGAVLDRPTLVILDSPGSVLLIDVHKSALFKQFDDERFYRMMREQSRTLHQRDVALLEMDGSALILVTTEGDEVLLWDIDAGRFTNKHILEQLRNIDSISFQRRPLLVTGHQMKTMVWDARQITEAPAQELVEEVELITAATVDGISMVAVLAWVDISECMRLTVRDGQSGRLLYKFERLDRTLRPHFIALCQTTDGPCVVFQSNWWDDKIEFHQILGKEEVVDAWIPPDFVPGPDGSFVESEENWWPERFTGVDFTVISVSQTQINPSKALKAFVKKVFDGWPSLDELWSNDPKVVVMDPLARSLAARTYFSYGGDLVSGLIFIGEKMNRAVIIHDRGHPNYLAAAVHNGKHVAVTVDDKKDMLMMWRPEESATKGEELIKFDNRIPVLALGEAAGQLMLAVGQDRGVTVLPLSEGNITNTLFIPERATALCFTSHDSLIVGTNQGVMAFGLGQVSGPLTDAGEN